MDSLSAARRPAVDDEYAIVTVRAATERTTVRLAVLFRSIWIFGVGTCSTILLRSRCRRRKPVVTAARASYQASDVGSQLQDVSFPLYHSVECTDDSGRRYLRLQRGRTGSELQLIPALSVPETVIHPFQSPSPGQFHAAVMHWHPPPILWFVHHTSGLLTRESTCSLWDSDPVLREGVQAPAWPGTRCVCHCAALKSGALGPGDKGRRGYARMFGREQFADQDVLNAP